MDILLVIHQTPRHVRKLHNLRVTRELVSRGASRFAFRFFALDQRGRMKVLLGSFITFVTWLVWVCFWYTFSDIVHTRMSTGMPQDTGQLCWFGHGRTMKNDLLIQGHSISDVRIRVTEPERQALHCSRAGTVEVSLIFCCFVNHGSENASDSR